MRPPLRYQQVSCPALARNSSAIACSSDCTGAVRQQPEHLESSCSLIQGLDDLANEARLLGILNSLHR
jgi:hypothetical protein